MNIPVLTIDGPSGAGKGTISRLVAQHLGWHYLDSGAIYRALAIALTEQNILLDNIPAIVKIAHEMELLFECGADRKVKLHGLDITELLVLENTGNAASKIAVIPEIRAALLDKQHDFKELPGLVADGRDMGTVVFPEAPYKIFLTANAEKRAQRRYKQLKEKGIDANLKKLIDEIQERDGRDSQRDHAPLKQADDAVFIDSSDMQVEEVLQAVLSVVD